MMYALRLTAVAMVTAMAARPCLAGVSPGLESRLNGASPSHRIRVIASLAAGPGEEARASYRHRRDRARQAEAPLRGALAARGIKDVRSLWAVHAVAFEAPPEAVRAVASRPDVARVDEDTLHQAGYPPLVPAPEPSGPVPRYEADLTWNLERIGAGRSWDLGFDGEGVTVGVIDSGVDAGHPDLAGRMVAGGWLDVVAGGPAPYDDSGHGTHITGILCGGSAGGGHIGVAPGARFIAVKALDGANRFYLSWVIEAGQWMADPDGDGDPADAPDIVHCSWSFGSATSLDFRPILELWRSVGIWPVFAAGNRGPAASSVSAPGTDPLALSVGMTNAGNVVADSSGRGPAPLYSPFDGFLKPDLVAPGVAILSAVPGGGYAVATGTSMSAPHVTGALALLKQTHPGLDFDAARGRVTRAAMDLGLPGPDTAAGHGLLDAYAALQMPDGYGPPALRGLVLGPGGQPVPDALVDASGSRTATGPDGWFTVPHVGAPAVNVQVDASGYAPRTLSVAPGTDALFLLEPRPESLLSGGGVEVPGAWQPSDSAGMERTDTANRTPGGAWALEVRAMGDGLERCWLSEPVPVPSGGVVSVNASYAWRATGDASGRTSALEWLDGAGGVIRTDYGTPFLPPTRGGPADGLWREEVQAVHASPPAGASWVRLRLGAAFASGDTASRMWFDDAAIDLARAPGTGAVTGLVTRDGEPAPGAIVGEHPFGAYFVPADGTGRYILVAPASERLLSAWTPGVRPAATRLVEIPAGDTVHGIDLALADAGRNAAPDGAPGASSTLDGGYNPARAADGSLETYWSSAVGGYAGPETPVWWSVDLGVSRSVGSVELFWESEPRRVRLSTSPDGVAWAPVVVSDGGGWRRDASRTVSVVNFEGRYTRFLRVEDIGSNILARMGLWEARVLVAPSLRPGDVDDSGTVTTEDAVAVLRAAGGLLDGTRMPANADVAPPGGDGMVTLADAAVIVGWLAGPLP